MSVKADATRRVVDRSGGRVVSGPFVGMRILPDLVSWGDGDVGARLLGVYEQELHDVVDEVVAAEPKCVVNVGCAEGYYAVGLALKLEDARIVAVDVSQRALDVTRAHAEANGVHVETALTIPADVPDDAVWLFDVEGDEAGLVDPVRFPTLKSASILVELHEWVHADLKLTLENRFADTHDVSVIVQGDRSVNQFDFLEDLTDEQRWSLAVEGRPRRMRWLWMVPR